MTKCFRKKVLPMLLAVILLFTLFPVTAGADGPEITIEPTDGSPSSASTSANSSSVDISIEPTDGDSSSSLPDNTDEDSSAEGDDITAESTTPMLETFSSGISVLDIGIQSTGNLVLTSHAAYQWDFAQGRGTADIQPWYTTTIDGVLAYCVEPTNPSTHSGGYTTIAYDELTITQQYSIGYAMLYGAQDDSSILFHMATQTIIWEIVFGYMDLSSFISVSNGTYDGIIGYNPGAAPYYDQILAAMRSHKQVPSFTRFLQAAAPIHKVPGHPGEYRVTLVNTNPNATLADFPFQNTGSVTFVREGEMLHVTSSSPLSGDTIYAAYKGAGAQTDSLIYWASGNDQIRCTAGILDPVPAYMRLATEDIGDYTITIRKLQDGTNIPLSGAQFHVRHAEKGEIGAYTTDGSGKVVVTVPWQGTYIVTEIVPPDNHLLDENAEKFVVISTDQPHVSLTYHNKPFTKGIEIQKLDSVTREPVAGVVFRVSWEGGFRHQTVTTNAAGVARLADLEPGFYEVEELSCPPGYILNTAPQTIELVAGEIAKVLFENTPKPGLSVQKVNSVTGLGMEGVEFEVEKVSGERIGTYITDAGGFFFVPVITEEEYMVIRETKTLPGYRIDTAEKLVKLEAGKLNKVVFTNSPWPFLVIKKVDKATGKPLAGAEYRVTGADGKAIGEYTTDHEGKIVLAEIEQQVVTVQEISAPDGYVLDDTAWEVELRWGCTSTISLRNVPLEIKVEVEKRGPVEAIAGQEIQYDLRNIRNNSSVPLEDFYLRDLLPTDAIRLVSITTGTWSEDLTYSVVYRTNLKESWYTLADGLITSVNHKLDCSQQVLNLASNEYVTEFKFLFGTVQPGFHDDKGPIVTCRVLADLPNEYTFTNRVDVGGRYGDKWTYDKDAWTSVVYLTPDKGKLPKTGVWE